jgi:hypothetical protein
LILDSSFVKKNKRFYNLIVLISLIRSIVSVAHKSKLSLRSKFHYILFLILSIQDRFIVKLPKIEFFIRKYLSNLYKLKVEPIDELLIQVNGWRANKDNQIIINREGLTEYLRIAKNRKLRLDVRKAFPDLSYFSGYESNKVALKRFNNSKLFTELPKNGQLFIAGENNFKFLAELNIKAPEQKITVKVENYIYIDDVKIYGSSDNAFLETLVFIVANSTFLHNILLKLTPIHYLKYIADELEPFQENSNISLFRSCVLSTLNRDIDSNVIKLNYVLDYKSKSNLSPSVIKLNFVSIYPENILVDSNNELRNEISLDPITNFNAHLSSYLYPNIFKSNEAFIKTGNYEVIKIRERVISLPCNPINNWFHLIFEGILPLIYNLDSINKNDKILIHENSPKQFKELLKLLDFKFFYELDAHKIYSIDSLVTFDSSIKIIDSLSNDQDLNHFSISKKALIFARLHFQKIINVPSINEKMDFPKKVLVLRKGKVRGLINREKIKNYCVANGYHTIYPEDETVKTQIDYFFTANEIILEGGAALANLIFCKEGTKITYLCSNITQNYQLVSMICNLLGLRLEVIAGETVPKINFRATSIYDIFHSSYQIKSV